MNDWSANTMITVTRQGGEDPLLFDVVVADAAGTSRHRVSLTRADLARLAGGRAPERLVEAAFRFLLEREPKESILARFDLAVIARYFPEFERELPRYLAGAP
ncbi:MAG: hypothetical protein ABSC25_02930 [Roseiarcus sp.]|jgi:hypothetical protein